MADEPDCDDRRSRQARRGLLALLALGSSVFVACGEDDQTRPEAQPVPGASTFGEGNFDELPRFPGAQAAAEPAVEQDVTTQSFTVATATPARVMEFYERELPESGWQVLEEPRRLGAERTHRGVWRSGNQQLVVSSTEFSHYDDPSAPRITQFSMSLGPVEE